MLVYFTAIWYILQPFGIFYSHLVYFTAIWYILQPFGIFYSHFGIFYGSLINFARVGTLYHEKSGNPVSDVRFFTDKSEIIKLVRFSAKKSFFFFIFTISCHEDIGREAGSIKHYELQVE
jgi:hypothetical protein